MRLKKASFAFAGAAAAVAITAMTASAAWACDDRDPALRLDPLCGTSGRPNWMVTNPNGWGAVPFTWADNEGGHSDVKMSAPAGGSVALPTHASKVIVVAYRPDMRDLPVWRNHGAAGENHCKPSAPTAPPSHRAGHKPTAKRTGEAPKPTTPPHTGEAGPATPVKAQPRFTG